MFDKLPERLLLIPRDCGEVGVGGVTVVSGAAPEFAGVIFRSAEREPPLRVLVAERDGEPVENPVGDLSGLVDSAFTPPLSAFRGGVLMGVAALRFWYELLTGDVALRMALTASGRLSIDP